MSQTVTWDKGSYKGTEVGRFTGSCGGSCPIRRTRLTDRARHGRRDRETRAVPDFEVVHGSRRPGEAAVGSVIAHRVGITTDEDSRSRTGGGPRARFATTGGRRARFHAVADR